MKHIINFGRLVKRQLMIMIDSNKRKARIGFVGCGRHATTNLYLSLKYTNSELVAVCAKHKNSAMRTAKLFGAERYYTDYENMFKTEKLDGVVICVNRTMHPRIIKCALMHDLNVFVEKPPATTSRELEDILLLARKKKKTVMIGYNKRFSTIYREIKRIMYSKQFGELSSYSARFSVGNSESVQDLIYEIGIHHLDLAQFLISQIKDIRFVIKQKPRPSISLLVNFKNSVSGTITISSSASWVHNNERVEIIGDSSIIVAEDMSRLSYFPRTRVHPGYIPADSEKEHVWRLNPVVPNLENNTLYTNGFIPEMRHFINLIIKNSYSSNTLSESINTLRIIEQITNKL